MAATFGWLAAHNYVAAANAAEFAVLAAHFLAELNAGHPFREGNGRTQLTFLRLLVLNAGLPFKDDALDPLAPSPP